MGKVTGSAPAAAVGTRRFSTGDLVEVYCDHHRKGERVRDWLHGVVVQADDKMAAVQFLDDVFLTDGWMVPDRVLWCLQGGDNIRIATRRRIPRPRGRRR